MRDDPRRNLKWLEQQLLEEEASPLSPEKQPEIEYDRDDDLLALVDMLIGEDETEEDPPIRNFANIQRTIGCSVLHGMTTLVGSHSGRSHAAR